MIFDIKIYISSKTIDGIRGRPITLLTSGTFILFILSCFHQWEICLIIIFIRKNPMEILAYLYGIEIIIYNILIFTE